MHGGSDVVTSVATSAVAPAAGSRWIGTQSDPKMRPQFSCQSVWKAVEVYRWNLIAPPIFVQKSAALPKPSSWRYFWVNSPLSSGISPDAVMDDHPRILDLWSCGGDMEIGSSTVWIIWQVGLSE